MKSFFAAALLLCLSAVYAIAQSQITTGAIQGTVSDSSGAVVSGAAVKVRNLDTNLEKNLTTDNNGRFVALLLPPGRYEVTINGKGFGTLVQQNINLTVGQTVTLVPQLRVAASTEQVVVTATPDIDTSKVESSSTLNERSIAQTPILGRKFEDFLTLTPGVSITQGPDGDEINFNGQRGIFNNVSLDGGDYNNGFFGEQAGGQRAAVDISLEAVKEFQVVASGASAEFGRSGGGIVNVITKSGTNDLHGSLFHFQRLEALASNTSDGRPLKDFHREQSGFTLGGPIQKNKQFFFVAFEQIGANLQRANLSEQTGTTPCPVATPTIQANEAAINANADCARLALLGFLRTPNAASGFKGQEEGLPIRRPTHNSAVLGKYDLNLNQANQLSASYSFDASRKVNETFDVATYGNSANGTEGTSYIHAFNLNLISTLSSRWLNEGHFTFSKEDRPRAAAASNIPADTAMGFATTFRFGAPFFLGPTVDETFKRFQFKDNISLVTGKHNVKFGADYLHSNNAQVFRGFFLGRYIFDSVDGFLRYASPQAPGGYGPSVQECTGGGFATIALAEPCAGGSSPLLLYLQGANGDLSPATDAAGASDINNEDFALFVQDKWQMFPNFTLSAGLRWEAQYMPSPTVDPSKTIYGPLLSNPAFPSNGTIPDQTAMFQPRLGIAWDIGGKQKSIFRASTGIFNAHQNMLTQVGSITTNGVQQATIAGGASANPTVLPTWPNLCTSCVPLSPGAFAPFSGIRIFDRKYKNPRIYSTNFAFEQQLIPTWVAYADFTWNKSVYLTNFLNYNRSDRSSFFPFFNSPPPGGTIIGEVAVTSSRANSLYRGLTLGLRKSFARRFQMDANYTFAADYDNDSNERDPFTDRSGPATATDPFPLHNDFSYSDRDIRNRFNLILSGDLPWGIEGNLRIQAHSAQPCTPLSPPDPKVCDGGTSGKRNTGRKDNAYSSVDWRIARPFKFGERYAIVPMFELFNTFNSKNNINPLVSPGLFNFDGYLRQGVGDPRQGQFAIRFTF
jgi:hypothetical protein